MPTQSRLGPQAHGGQPPQPGYPQPGYSQGGYPPPQGNQTISYQNPMPQVAAPPVVENRKPIGLLIGMVLLLIAIVSGGAVMVVQGRMRSQGGVTSVKIPGLPTGPGVQQSSSPEAPVAPGVMANRTPAPTPGHPVTGQVKPPSDMAPSVLMGPGAQAPAAPSVVSGQVNPQVPQGPSPLTMTPTPAPNAPPVTAVRAPTPKPAAPPPAPPDNSDFDRYLRWLQYVENEREGLRAAGETESFRVIQQFYDTLLGLSDPDANDAQIQRQMDQNMRVTLQRTVSAITLFRQNIVRTKPGVPADCLALDQYYMSAVAQEGVQTAALLQALAQKDIGAVKRVSRSGVGKIDRDLGMANLKLEQVYRQRGLNQQFKIQTGGNSSMLGGMMGLGGMGGF